MNFVAEWSVKQCGDKYGCAVCTKNRCMPREVLSSAAGCSVHLVGLLQYMHGAVTHPNIADRIADYIGATSEERDQIVARKHHGKYVPGKSKPPVQHTVGPVGGALEIVAIDPFGNEVGRFPSSACAADDYSINYKQVLRRCKRQMTTYDEFRPAGVTFRYAREWDIMSRAMRLLDIGCKFK